MSGEIAGVGPVRLGRGIKVLDDRVLVRRDPAPDRSAGGIFLPDQSKDRPDEGEVVAAGPGKLYPSPEREEVFRVPMGVRVGDKVVFLRQSGVTLRHEGEDLVVLHEADIVAVVEARTIEDRATLVEGGGEDEEDEEDEDEDGGDGAESVRNGRIFREWLTQKPDDAIVGLTDLVRTYLVEHGCRPLPGVATVPGTGDLICVVEGLVPVYHSDFAVGPAAGRFAIRDRVVAALRPGHEGSPARGVEAREETDTTGDDRVAG